MLDTYRLASYNVEINIRLCQKPDVVGRQGDATMKPQNPVIWCLTIVCLTILAFTLLTRHSLYELRIRDGSREVAAVMSCESNQ